MGKAGRCAEKQEPRKGRHDVERVNRVNWSLQTHSPVSLGGSWELQRYLLVTNLHVSVEKFTGEFWMIRHSGFECRGVGFMRVSLLRRRAMRQL